MRVSENRVNQIRVNQGLGVLLNGTIIELQKHLLQYIFSLVFQKVA